MSYSPWRCKESDMTEPLTCIIYANDLLSSYCFVSAGGCMRYLFFLNSVLWMTYFEILLIAARKITLSVADVLSCARLFATL